MPKLSRIVQITCSLAGVVLLLVSAPVVSLGQESLTKSASWEWPEVANFEEHLLSYLDQLQADEPTRRQVDEFWNSTTTDQRGPALLDRLLNAASLVEPRIDALRLQLTDPSTVPMHPRDIPWLTSDVPGWLQDTLRLACGRAFAQRRLYDEALESLSGLELVQVCDPSSLIFYRATCEHHLMQQQECLANVALLLEHEDELPVRYAQVAHLMQSDIEPLETDSLDEVARLMRDVERRLGLGRAGTRVREEEDEIVEKLDKLIDQIEEQMQKQQQQRSQQNNGQQEGQTQPLEESQIAGGSGPGDVDDKENGNRAGWGNLPPAERQESLQRLTEELPSHYRDVIEGYFRQLAKEQR